MKPKLSTKAKKSFETWNVNGRGPVHPYPLKTQANKRFHQALSYGESWEEHVGKRLPNKYHGYDVKHVSEILPEGQYRLNNNKYPDFTLCNHNTKQMILIDAKRKNGYDPSQGDQYVTMDETYVDSYQNVQKYYEDQGWKVSGKIYFFVEMKMDLYVANDFQPHDWKRFDNQYGREVAGIYYLKQMSKDSKVLKGWIK